MCAKQPKILQILEALLIPTVQFIVVGGHGHTRPPTKDEVRKLIHHSDDGPVLKDNKCDAECSSNCHCSRN